MVARMPISPIPLAVCQVCIKLGCKNCRNGSQDRAFVALDCAALRWVALRCAGLRCVAPRVGGFVRNPFRQWSARRISVPESLPPVQYLGRPAFRKITLLPLLAATYLMVAGGPYGLEDLVKNTGYGLAIVVLLLVPVFWSLPTALMVSELSSAMPEEGGYYYWVRRAMGPFWGFQEAWLSLAASIFDMAIYPVLFVTYLGFLCHEPRLAKDYPALLMLIGGGVIVVCVFANIRGARLVGGSSLLMLVALLGPFVVLTVVAFGNQPVSAEKAPPVEIDFVAGFLVAMFNYMGWDNASTIAVEVAR